MKKITFDGDKLTCNGKVINISIEAIHDLTSRSYNTDSILEEIYRQYNEAVVKDRDQKIDKILE